MAFCGRGFFILILPSGGSSFNYLFALHDFSSSWFSQASLSASAMKSWRPVATLRHHNHCCAHRPALYLWELGFRARLVQSTNVVHRFLFCWQQNVGGACRWGTSQRSWFRQVNKPSSPRFLCVCMDRVRAYLCVCVCMSVCACVLVSVCVCKSLSATRWSLR